MAGGDQSFPQDQNGQSFNMNRLLGAYEAPVSFNTVQGSTSDENFTSNISGEISGAPPFRSYEYEGGARNGAHSGSTALYQHNGSRYGLALGNGRFMPQENNTMGGLDVTKHKRACKVNCFALMYLEDLLGKISLLCKTSVVIAIC